MSADSIWDVQTGIFTRLTAVSALTTLLATGANSVLDHVPGARHSPSCSCYKVACSDKKIPCPICGNFLTNS